MSHFKERKEKVCLNCNAAIYGKFCHICGQENIEPKESFWSLVTHFFFDLIHFDGKFFSTLKYLLFKPGFLAEEHSKGRRADYLHPIRLYIFVSAFFFLIIFSFYDNEHETKKELYERHLTELNNKKEKVQKAFEKDTVALKERKLIADSFITIINKDIAKLKIDSSIKVNFASDSLDFAKVDNTYLRKKKRSNIKTNLIWFKRYLEKKENKFSSKEEFNNKLVEVLTHSIPKGLFIALPFYALFLMMFYARNKKYNYVNHLLFSIYLFSFTFILILCRVWTNSLFNLMSVDLEEVLTIISVFAAMIYTYKALRYYYQQSRTKTILKFLLLTLSCFIILSVVTTLLLIYSVKAI